ncbi:MAG: hypothetical protein ABSG19_12445 [Candidatus Aminicenantales bacterium]
MSLSLRKIEAEGAKKTKTKHGVKAYLRQRSSPAFPMMNLPSGRAWKRTQQDLMRLKDELFASPKYGGPGKVSPDVRAILESAIEGLTVQKLSALYIRRAGIMRMDSLLKGNLELHSILSGQFISYANLVRLNLEAAARLAGQKIPEPPATTLAEIIRECDEEEAKAKEAAAGGAGVSQGERSAAPPSEGEGQDGAESGDNRQGEADGAPGIAQEGRSSEDEGQDIGAGQGDDHE